MKPKGFNRRDFLCRLTAMAFVFNILPPASQYHRIWQALRPTVYPNYIRSEFGQFLIDQTPVFDQMILEDMMSLYDGPSHVRFDGRTSPMIDERFNILPPKLKDPRWERPLYFPTSEEVSAYG